LPTQAYPYLVMTDGADSVTFADGLGGLTSFPPLRGQWAPAIAGIRTSQMGGRGLYADVVEDLSCTIRGTTAALCYQNLDTLVRLLDKAERWWLRNENISPVKLLYAPQGSTIHSNATPLQAIVLGRVGTEDLSGVALPADANDAGMLFEIRDVRVRVLRRGQWIGAIETASAPAVLNPATLSITMPSTAPMLSPIQIDFTGFTTLAGTGNIEIPSGFVFIGPNSSISLLQGEAAATSSLAASTTQSNVADAAARASGGSVKRLNSSLAVAGPENTFTWTLPAAFAFSTQIGIFLTYRNNSATSWNLRATAWEGVASGNEVSTPTISLPAVATDPTALFLGIVNNVRGFDTVLIGLAPTAISGLGTIDIDTLVVIDLSTPAMAVLALQANQLALGASFASKSAKVTIDNSPYLLRDPSLSVPIVATALTLPITYSGDPALIASGLVIQAMWYATHLWNGATPYWTTQNVGGTAILSIGATITRRLGYVSPQ
jgi:hypothetical protein